MLALSKHLIVKSRGRLVAKPIRLDLEDIPAEDFLLSMRELL